jgi:hypothetical protein
MNLTAVGRQSRNRSRQREFEIAVHGGHKLLSSEFVPEIACCADPKKRQRIRGELGQRQHRIQTPKKHEHIECREPGKLQTMKIEASGTLADEGG